MEGKSQVLLEFIPGRQLAEAGGGEGRMADGSDCVKYPHTPLESQGVCGHSELGDRADVRLTKRLLDKSVTSVAADDAAGAAESQSNLGRVVLLEDGIEEVERAANHSLDFRIDQFTHFNHDLSLNVNDI